MSFSSRNSIGKFIVIILAALLSTGACLNSAIAAPEIDTDLPSQYQIRNPVLSWETGEGNSQIIPALEIPASVVLLNIFDRLVFSTTTKEGKKAYNTNPSTFWDHLKRQNWHYDQDSFEVNQFGHPYQGSIFYGLARSAGNTFWQSLLYSHAGSFLWEMGGETSRPSVNDLFTTGNAGSLLGEALFRMSSLVLEDEGPTPSRRNELAAAVISPATGFNRFAFGDRFKSIFPAHRPATLWQVSAGVGRDLHASRGDDDSNISGEFSMAYGLPGKPGYAYKRPLDYFDFHLGLRSRAENVLEAVSVRGLLIGKDYHLGPDYRGIWGLYGVYDYISPRLYRISSTAIGLGTTAQFWAAPGVALQGTLVGALGFGAAGTETEKMNDDRYYHFGATPEGVLALGIILGERAMMDLTGRIYYVNGSSVDQLIFRGDAGITVRLSGNHGIGVRYSESYRNAENPSFGPKHLSEGTLSVVYTFVSDKRFGAVEWREPGAP